MRVIENYINGQLVAPMTETYLDSYEPATGEVYAKVPKSSEADVHAAVAAAKAAFPQWSQLSADDRCRYLDRIAWQIEESLEELALSESQDNGKPIALAKSVDIPRSAANFRFFAAAGRTFGSESHHGSGSINYTRRDPLGVVACISPWNLPLYLFTWKIAPALAAGNTVVAKPSEVTPMTAYLLSKICLDVGLPPGVLNIVHGLGPEVGAPLCCHQDVQGVSFTGGTATGKAIAESLAGQFKKVSLELGGKNPNIIFADCDLDKAIDTSLRSSFANQGQICLCGSRIFVESSVYDQFKKGLLDRVASLTIGDPSTDVDQGALVSKEHYEKVLAAIAKGKEEGGTILVGGKPPAIGGRCANGWFVEPTVFEGLDPYGACNQEEIFGPVVTLTPFQEENELLTWVNSTNYGLAASIWTKDIDRAQRMAQRIKSGIIWINTWMNRDLRTPFGGMKQSGLGREGGWEAMKFFTEAKNVCIEFG